MRSYLMIMALVLTTASASPAAPLKLDLQQWQLPNGLRVVFLPRHNVPAVTVQVWYHVGSKNEPPNRRGVAHMFEHLMFKGSKNVAPEKHAQMIAAIGGSTNAFTSEDVTAYHNTLPKQYLAFAMQLEAERMHLLDVTDATIKSEREVVKEEKRLRLDNNPIGRTLEAMYALAYKKHPYAWTPAGDIEDLNNTPKQFYLDFYRTYYSPNNATLIVVGDATTEAVRAAADKYFGKIPPSAVPNPMTTKEPESAEQRRQTANWPSQLGVVLGSYLIVEAKHPDATPLQVLSAILSAGRSSRLYQRLVRREKVALEAGGFASVREHPGLFLLYGVALPGQDLAKVESQLLSEVQSVASRGVTAQELSKAKNQLSTDYLQGLRSLYGLANQIGQSAYLEGNPSAFLDDVEEIDRVTVADIQRVAQIYLRPSRLNMIVLPASGASKGAN